MSKGRFPTVQVHAVAVVNELIETMVSRKIISKDDARSIRARATQKVHSEHLFVKSGVPASKN